MYLNPYSKQSIVAHLIQPKLNLEKVAVAVAPLGLCLSIIGALAFLVHFPAVVSFMNTFAFQVGATAGGGSILLSIVIALLIRGVIESLKKENKAPRTQDGLKSESDPAGVPPNILDGQSIVSISSSDESIPLAATGNQDVQNKKVTSSTGSESSNELSVETSFTYVEPPTETSSVSIPKDHQVVEPLSSNGISDESIPLAATDIQYVEDHAVTSSTGPGSSNELSAETSFTYVEPSTEISSVLTPKGHQAVEPPPSNNISSLSINSGHENEKDELLETHISSLKNFLLGEVEANLYHQFITPRSYGRFHAIFGKYNFKYQDLRKELKAGNDENWIKLEDKIRSLAKKSSPLTLKGRKIKWITGTRSPTLIGLTRIAETALTKVPALVSTGNLLKYKIVPLTGELQMGILPRGVNNSSLSGTTLMGLDGSYSYANNKSFVFNKKDELNFIKNFNFNNWYAPVTRLKVAILRLIVTVHLTLLSSL